VGDRAVFVAVVYVLTSGCAWRRLPSSFGIAVPTAYRRFVEWSNLKLWDQLDQAVSAHGDDPALAEWMSEIRHAAGTRPTANG
jgi:transposase